MVWCPEEKWFFKPGPQQRAEYKETETDVCPQV